MMGGRPGVVSTWGRVGWDGHSCAERPIIEPETACGKLDGRTSPWDDIWDECDSRSLDSSEASFTASQAHPHPVLRGLTQG